MVAGCRQCMNVVAALAEPDFAFNTLLRHWWSVTLMATKSTEGKL